MIPSTSPIAVAVFGFFVAVVLGLSFYLGAKAKSAQGYFAAHGEIPWFVNGVAFAGDYLSAASFLGICGMISFYGYDGFLYSIGYLAGWVVALFVIAEPLKAMGKFTFADALDRKFNSKGIKLAAAISTLVVSIFYLIPQMVGAGKLVKPLLGFDHVYGVTTVGVVVIFIVVTAGMVSTTWVQFIKGAMLVLFCAILTAMILARGLTTESVSDHPDAVFIKADVAELEQGKLGEVLAKSGDWAGPKGADFFQVADSAGRIRVWHKVGDQVQQTQSTEFHGKDKFVNGLPWGAKAGQTDFVTVGRVVELPGGVAKTGGLNPISYLATLQTSKIELWDNVKLTNDSKIATTVYYPKIVSGKDVLTPGASSTFKGIRSDKFYDKLNFLSLMLALFGGTASLPHILIRYYTVKDQAAARKSTVVGIASIGFFYILTLYLGLGAMTSGHLDVTDNNMAAPLLARSFGELPFAVISAIAFTTVLGTVSGLILAASGAVAHDLLESFLQIKMNDYEKVRSGKLAAIVIGAIAIVLGICFEKMNVTFLVGWAFNIAASANLPSLVMLLFWSRTTKAGITAAIMVGMISSLGWVLLSADAFKDVYGLKPEDALVPFSQPGIITIPLGFLVLVLVSLVTDRTRSGVK